METWLLTVAVLGLGLCQLADRGGGPGVASSNCLEVERVTQSLEAVRTRGYVISMDELQSVWPQELKESDIFKPFPVDSKDALPTGPFVPPRIRTGRSYGTLKRTPKGDPLCGTIFTFVGSKKQPSVPRLSSVTVYYSFASKGEAAKAACVFLKALGHACPTPTKEGEGLEWSDGYIEPNPVLGGKDAIVLEAHVVHLAHWLVQVFYQRTPVSDFD